MSKTEVTEAVEDAGTQMIDELLETRSRLMNIGFRLTRAASSLCGKWNRPHPGVLVTKRSSFEERKIRDVASKTLLAGDEITVVHVVPDGPFARAGLRSGDELLAVAGKRMKSSEDLMQHLLELTGASAVGVRFRREGALEQIATVPLDLACPVRFGYSTSALIVPWQNQRAIISIPLGLLKHAADDATLAVAMGHQLAHALFDKPDDEALQSEIRADSLGLQITAAAGFDVRSAIAYWEDVAAEYPQLIGPAGPDWRPLAWTRPMTLDYDQFLHADIARRLGPMRKEIERRVGA